MTDPTSWIKASASAQESNCIEQRHSAGLVEVRDSKDKTGPVLRLPRTGYAAWLAAARSGELDQLLG